MQIIAVQVTLFATVARGNSFLFMNPTMNTAMLHKRNISHVPFPVLFGRLLTVTGTAGRCAAPGAAATPVAEAAAD